MNAVLYLVAYEMLVHLVAFVPYRIKSMVCRPRPRLVGVGGHFPNPALRDSSAARVKRLVACGNVSVGLSHLCGSW